ncbi:MAG: EamA family transporter [Blastocatellia bacterium]|nr:EamA family transporter [Blastocatellia bacterium]
MKTVFFVAIIVFAGAFGDIMLSRGMKQVGEVNTLNVYKLFSMAWRTITTPAVLIGIGFMAIAFFSLLAALSIEKVSIVEPATAVAYVINTIGAKFYLKEEVDNARWMGSLFVCLGAFLLSVK